jgi:hypothetical protein
MTSDGGSGDIRLTSNLLAKLVLPKLELEGAGYDDHGRYM